MRKFGLIGKSLKHSFSKDYFNSFFKNEGISDAEYNLYELDDITKITELLKHNKDICGLNITIPYKESIIPFLDVSDDIVKETGACNCVKIVNNKLYGYNTDVYGFMHSFLALMQTHHHKAIILGNGGAAKSVIYSLEQLSIDYTIIARKPKNNTEIAWSNFKEEHISQSNIIINTTPIGMYPYIEDFPQLPYSALNRFHLVYDLIYNPEKSVFLQKAESQDATIKNGMEMLVLQAEESWRIWNS